MSLKRMPAAEAAHIDETYRKASVILEYGSGDSTRRAADLGERLVISVESDPVWARNLRDEIEAAEPLATVVIHYTDIGPTGEWGRPLSDRAWRNFHNYPNEVWDEPYFQHPDVVLIDGRFRTACLITTMLRVTRPVTVLFDDYSSRPRYRQIERILKPVNMVGRMAEFHVVPGMLKSEHMSFAIAQYFQAVFHGDGNEAYQLPASGTQNKKIP